MDMAYAHESPPPSQQLQMGVSPHAVQCNHPTELYLLDSNIPLCLTSSSYKSLLDNGVDLTLPSLKELVVSIDDAGPEDIMQIVEAMKAHV